VVTPSKKETAEIVAAPAMVELTWLKGLQEHGGVGVAEALDGRLRLGTARDLHLGAAVAMLSGPYGLPLLDEAEQVRAGRVSGR
jgi:hypothetical protein